MTTKLTREQLMGQIAEAAVAFQLAETKRNSLRRELNSMYKTYFDAHGRPYADTSKRVNPYDEAFAGVIRFTDAAYDRWYVARNLTTKLKRNMRTLIQRLERSL
ncbi:hypothetical protein HZF02_01715 [Pseudomonas yamanorum]|nr:hypothetical protein HZF02_01715 [Pseudomonas yamanorum]